MLPIVILPGYLESAIALIQDSKGIERSRALAADHARLAVEHLADLPPSQSKQALINMADYVLSRMY